MVGFPLLGVYSATKGAEIRMTETMALELRDHGVRYRDVPGVRRHRHGCALGHRFHCGHRYAVRRICRQGRLAKPDEIAGLAVYLASDEASFVNGAAIAIDGGINVRRF